MLVRCPDCGSEFRLREIETGRQTVRYLCPHCDRIVAIDLEAEAADAAEPASRSGRRSEMPKTVLVADDSPEVLKRVEELLSGEGYRVVLAPDGDAALQAARDFRPDLLLLDLLMPKRTGFDVLRDIRKDERLAGLPVLAMSSVYKDNVLDFLKRVGAIGMIDKEAIGDHLVFRVRSILGGEDTAPDAAGDRSRREEGD